MLAFGTLVCAPTFALANDSSISFEGGTPHIEDEPDVEMVREHLRFTYLPWRTLPPPKGVTCTEEGQVVPGSLVGEPVHPVARRPWVCDWVRYRLPEPYWAIEQEGVLLASLRYEFHNHSDRKKQLQIGLPFLMPTAEDAEDGDVSGPTIEEDIADFVTLVDGEPAVVRRVDLSKEEQAAQQGVRFNRVYIVEVSFAPGETRRLEHRYRSEVTLQTAGGGQTFSYLLRTGVGWRGPIGEAVIEFQWPGVGPCLDVSMPFTREGDVIKVVRKNWEPDIDFSVLFETNEAIMMMESDMRFDVFQGPSSCDNLLTEPPARMRKMVATLELAYGAPHEPSRLAAGDRAHVFCSAADQWAGLGFMAKEGDEDAQRAIEAMHYTEDPRYPETMPDALQRCLQRAHAKLSADETSTR